MKSPERAPEFLETPNLDILSDLVVISTGKIILSERRQVPDMVKIMVKIVRTPTVFGSGSACFPSRSAPVDS
jgi:hypothetical protein